MCSTQQFAEREKEKNSLRSIRGDVWIVNNQRVMMMYEDVHQNVNLLHSVCVCVCADIMLCYYNGRALGSL